MKTKRFSTTELILYIIVWAVFKGLFLRIAIPQIQGELPINGMLLITEGILLLLSTVMVYEIFNKK